MANQKRIPFIPKLSHEFKPMRHYYCETETTAKLISRSVFLRLLAEQPYPMGQVSIDFDGGFAYLFPYDPERAEQFAAAYREFETEYKRFYREQEDNRAGRRMTVVHLDQFDDTAAEGDDIVSAGGKVNVRCGNGITFSRITSVKNGTAFEWIATAQNGWHAIVVNGQVGWVSGQHSKIA